MNLGKKENSYKKDAGALGRRLLVHPIVRGYRFASPIKIYMPQCINDDASSTLVAISTNEKRLKISPPQSFRV